MGVSKMCFVISFLQLDICCAPEMELLGVLYGEALPPCSMRYHFIYGQLLREKSSLLYNLLINLPHTYIVVWNFAVLFNCCENTVFKTWIHHKAKIFHDIFAALKRSVSLFQGLSTVQIGYSKFENESYIRDL